MAAVAAYAFNPLTFVGESVKGAISTAISLRDTGAVALMLNQLTVTAKTLANGLDKLGIAQFHAGLIKQSGILNQTAADMGSPFFVGKTVALPITGAMGTVVAPLAAITANATTNPIRWAGEVATEALIAVSGDTLDNEAFRSIAYGAGNIALMSVTDPKQFLGLVIQGLLGWKAFGWTLSQLTKVLSSPEAIQIASHAFMHGHGPFGPGAAFPT